MAEIFVTDVFAPRFPVSVKGIVRIDGHVVLCKNRRDEWELPGGKLEPGEDPATCVRREIEEELGLQVTPTALVDCWLYDVLGQVEVLIVTYDCRVDGGELRASWEHEAVQRFDDAAIDGLPMPDGYKRSIARASGRIGRLASA